jgi:hypothetical protein
LVYIFFLFFHSFVACLNAGQQGDLSPPKALDRTLVLLKDIFAAQDSSLEASSQRQAETTKVLGWFVFFLSVFPIVCALDFGVNVGSAAANVCACGIEPAGRRHGRLHGQLRHADTEHSGRV